MAEYVIIGNGVAATACVEGIRSRDTVSPITVVSGEKHPAYCRPLISYYLEGRTTIEKMRYRPADFYEKNGVKVLCGVKANSVDAGAKTVALDDGSSLSYTALCVAAGSSPFVPPFKGLDTVEKKFSFMTIDDTLALEEAITPESRVFIVGAGLIGLKCAEGIAERVKSVTVCDLAPRVLSSILDDTCAAIVQKRLEDHGFTFLLGDSADSFDGNTAHMKSGKDVEFDVLVLAIGVRANTKIVSAAGVECGRGITVDTGMHTSVKDIYAAGDCAEGMDITFGKNRVLAILPNAYMQGHCAGVNMAGGSEKFDNTIPMNSIGFFGYHIMTAGSYYGPDQGGELYEKADGDTLRRMYTKDGYLTGYMLLGDVTRGGIYTSMVRNRIPLSEVDYEMLKEHATLAAFSPKYRKQKLGGVV